MTSADARDTIQPRTLKGFRDLLPAAAMAREELITRTVGVYRMYGFSPIETPALEYTEILLGKGSEESDKQMYRFEDLGGRDVAMRFDLTVPLARYVAQHIGTLGAPFKRYHVGTVWRAENTQRGRYREFLQCDFDTIGSESVMADIETALVIADVFSAIGIDRFTVRVNNRKVLTGLLERIGLVERSAAVLRGLDKLSKIGADRVADELRSAAGATDRQVDDILRLAAVADAPAPTADVHDEARPAVPPETEHQLGELEDLVLGSEAGEQGIRELRDLFDGVAVAAPSGRIVLDPSIARGLDYYTGVVFETFLDDLPAIGSCMSGGRYDDLASVYTTQRLPGVGASLGVDRLLAALDELDAAERPATPARVLVCQFDEHGSHDALELAAELRRADIPTEIYPDVRKLGPQLKYADRKGHEVAVIVGPDEREAGTVQVKVLATGESQQVARGDAAVTLRTSLDI